MILLRTILRLMIWLLLLLKVYLSSGQADLSSVSMNVPFVSSAFSMSDEDYVYYELQLANLSSYQITLNQVNVKNRETGDVIFHCDSDCLQQRLVNFDRKENGKNPGLGAGICDVLYLEFPLPEKDGLKVIHELDFTIEDKNYSIQGAEIYLPNNPVILGSPLKGGPWTAIYSPDWERGHRRVIYTVNGQARIPGRFAIDFMKLDAAGMTSAGDSNNTTNWYGYGASVLAVAEGTVLSVETYYKDSPTIDSHPRYAAKEATGNYISLDIGNGNIVFYEHLQAGSIRVKPGQKVSKGSTIAQLGFTGQSSGPHLHFHVANTNSPLGAEGIAFVFDQFEFLGEYSDFSTFGKIKWDLEATNRAMIRKKERPRPNSVIEFQ